VAFKYRAILFASFQSLVRGWCVCLVALCREADVRPGAPGDPEQAADQRLKAPNRRIAVGADARQQLQLLGISVVGLFADGRLDAVRVRHPELLQQLFNGGLLV